MDHKAAIKLIEQHTIYGLGALDGCMCCYFMVHNVHVNVSCRKSEHSIRVFSHTMYRDAKELEEVARVVIGQVSEAEEYRVRFCEWSDDHYMGHRSANGGCWVTTQKCCWCTNRRDKSEGYLCDLCRRKQDAVNAFPWITDGFLDGSFNWLTSRTSVID